MMLTLMVSESIAQVVVEAVRMWEDKMEKRLTGRGIYDTKKPPQKPKKPKAPRVKVVLANKYGRVKGEQ